MEALAEEKRLIEVERFKLQEKSDKLEESQKTLTMSSQSVSGKSKSTKRMRKFLCESCRIK